MGLLDWFRSSEKRDNRQTFLSAAIGGLGANTGVSVTKDSSISFGAVWACVRVLSESIASLPIHVYREDADGDRVVDKAHPVYNLIARDPNGFMTSYTWRETLMSNLLLEGNSYYLIKRDSNARPISLIYLNTDDVKVIKSEGHLFYEVKGLDQPVLAQDMLHFLGLGFDGCKGKSVLRVHQDTIGLSLGANITAGSYFGNASQVQGVLRHPGKMTKEAVDRLRDSWNNRLSGSYNSHKTAILEEGMDFKPVTISANDRQLLDSRRFQVNEIARIFRVPPHMIGDLEKATFSNIEMQSIEFVTHTLRPYLVNIESELNRKLFRENERSTHYIKLNVEGLLRGDSQARAKYYKELMGMGVLSVNEVRRFEDLNKIGPEGDVHYIPLNFGPIGKTDSDE